MSTMSGLGSRVIARRRSIEVWASLSVAAARLRDARGIDRRSHVHPRKCAPDTPQANCGTDARCDVGDSNGRAQHSVNLRGLSTALPQPMPAGIALLSNSVTQKQDCSAISGFATLAAKFFFHESAC
jgi:hypothetical protein